MTRFFNRFVPYLPANEYAKDKGSRFASGNLDADPVHCSKQGLGLRVSARRGKCSDRAFA